MIRVVVAEDSPTARALLVEVLRADAGISVVGEARTGSDAVAMADALRPDLITMDIEMPVMDGLEAARVIMERSPTPIVVVSASTTGRDAERSIDAIAAGALSVIEKPASPLSEGFEAWRAHFVATVKAMANVKVVRRIPRRGDTPPDLPRLPAGSNPVEIVAIAASTGGPAVLLEILRRLPKGFPAPIVVVQHIADGFTGALAAWLNDGCPLHVRVAREGEHLAGGTVYIAPDGFQIGFHRGKVRLSKAQVGQFCPSATYLFEQAAACFGESVIAVILTGMGADGVQGLHRVRAAGGRVLAQDEASCVVYGMPREAVRAGVVDAVLTPPEIARHLVLSVRREARES